MQLLLLLLKNDQPDLKSTVILNTAEAYEQIGNFEKANIALRQYKEIREKINNADITGKITSIQVLYETDKKTQEVLLANAKIKLLEKEKDVRNFRILFLSLLALALTTTLVFSLRNQKLKKKYYQQTNEILHNEKRIEHLENAKLKLDIDLAKNAMESQARDALQKEALLLEAQKVKHFENENLKQELQLKNNELSYLSLNAMHKKELVLKLKEKMSNLMKSNLEGNARAYNQIFSEILNFEDEWIVFKSYFEQVNPSFFSNLSKSCPALTQTDLRHCAYIKIGLQTKEIASLLNITPESVQKSRMRLKKKMEIGAEIDLISYVKNTF